jgi:hypothetical protein
MTIMTVIIVIIVGIIRYYNLTINNVSLYRTVVCMSNRLMCTFL